MSATPYALQTPVAFKLAIAAIGGAALGLIIGVFALRSIWIEGYRGAGRASFGVFLSLVVLAVPLSSARALWRLPFITDVTTDPDSPPAFDRLAKTRPPLANAIHYEAAFAALQKQAYPDITPLFVRRPIADVYAICLDAANAMKWKIVEEQAAEASKAGRIEATDRTLVFGFVDDVVVRISPWQKQTKIDVRSSSRYGTHDLGRNAERVQAFLTDLKARFAKLDQAEAFEHSSFLGRLSLPGRGQKTSPSVSTTPQDEAETAPKRVFPAAAFDPPPSATGSQSAQSADADPAALASQDAQDPSQQAAQAAPKRRRRRHQEDGFRGFRRFWEGIGQ